MATLSVLILTKNEASNIKDCINSCAFADEILVIDDCSNDDTKIIAEQTATNVRVISHALQDDWAQQRNFAIAQAKGDFVLFIDADERISKELGKSIQSVISGTSLDVAYEFKRVNQFAQGTLKHGVFRPDWVCRLFPRQAGHYVRPVHERLIINLTIQKIKGDLFHHTYPTWDIYWRKFDKYTQISAENYYHEGKRINFILDIVLRPFWAFFKIYILNLGCLDGKLGFIFSVNHALYTMTKYVRLKSLSETNGKI